MGRRSGWEKTLSRASAPPCVSRYPKSAAASRASAGIELESDEGGEGLLRRAGGRPSTAQGLADLLASRKLLARGIDDDVDPAGDDRKEVLQGRQRPLLLVRRRRVEESLADVVAEVGDVRGIDRRSHLLDLRGVDLEALSVSGERGLDLSAQPRSALEECEVRELLGGEIDADLGDVDADLLGERGDVRLDEDGLVVGSRGSPTSVPVSTLSDSAPTA